MSAENMPRVGSALVVRDGKKILLARRNKDPSMGKWVLPGGKIEPFESIASAGEREIREETGIDVAVADHIGVFEIIAPPKEHRIIIYSWADFIGGSLREGSDALEPRFFDREEISTLDLTETVSAVLRKIGWV